MCWILCPCPRSILGRKMWVHPCSFRRAMTYSTQWLPRVKIYIADESEMIAEECF